MNKVPGRLILLISFIVFSGNVYSAVVSGKVYDHKSGKVLSGANISLQHSQAGTVTNSAGKFSLTVKVVDTLCVSFMGYKSECVDLAHVADLRNIKIRLEPVVIEMPEVGITRERLGVERRMVRMDPSIRVIDAEALQYQPAMVFPDLFRLLQRTPGVSFSSEASPQLSVRGGNTDQNLVLLDGAPIYYPYHFMGLATSFNMDMIDNIYFSLGGFSTAYGNRTSSVLSIQSKTPGKTFKTRANLNLTGGDITTGGTIGNKWAWLASGRLGSLMLLGSMIDVGMPSAYMDGLFKLEYFPADNQIVRFLLFGNSDGIVQWSDANHMLSSSIDDDSKKVYKRSSLDLTWGNWVGSLSWENKLNKDMHLKTQSWLSVYNNSFNNSIDPQLPDDLEPKFNGSKSEFLSGIAKERAEIENDVRNRFYDLTAKTDMDWSISENLLIRGGVGTSRFITRYHWSTYRKELQERFNLFFDYAPQDGFDWDKSFYQQFGYAENEWQISDELRLRTGLRADNWSFNDGVVLQPRASASYRFSDNTRMTLAGGRYAQGVSAALEEGLVQFLELYFPVDAGNSVEISDQVIAEFSTKFKGVDVSFSAYNKTMSGLLKSVYGEQLTFDQATGRSRGVEAMISTKLGGWSGWASYALNRSEREYGGMTYPSHTEQQHRVQASLSKIFKRGYMLSLFWEIHSGQPYNPGVIYGLRPLWDVYSLSRPHNPHVGREFPYEMDVPPGSIRYPWYHRLDISFAKVLNFNGATVAPFFSVYNAYYRKNVLYYGPPFPDFELKDGEWVNPHIHREVTSMRIVPTAGIRFQF